MAVAVVGVWSLAGTVMDTGSPHFSYVVTVGRPATVCFILRVRFLSSSQYSTVTGAAVPVAAAVPVPVAGAVAVPVAGGRCV